MPDKPTYEELEQRLKELEQQASKHREAENQVKHQAEFLNLVLESLPHPFYVIDAFDYTIKVANSAARMGRLSKGTTCYALTHRSDRPCGWEGHPCPLEQVKKTKQPVTVEHVHYDKDGNPRNVEVHAYPILDSEGNVCQVIESSLDVTDRKQAEEALQKAHNELEKRVEERTSGLVKANEQLKREIADRKRAEEAQRESEKRMYREQKRIEMLKFANDLALKLMHELRNPLVAVGGFAARISNHDYPKDKLKDYTGLIFEESKRLDNALEEVVAHLKTSSEQI